MLRLVRAHRDLAKAELSEILDEVKQLAILAGVALAALMLLGILFPVGLTLFLGEWLFGSIGWGLLHGTLLLLAVAVTAILAGVGVATVRIGINLLVAVVIGAVLGVLLALGLPNAVWALIGDSVGLGVDPAIRPLVIGVIVLGLVGAIIGSVVAASAAGRDGALAGLLAGLVSGIVLGAFSAITFGAQAGAAIGVSAALIAWPVLSGIALAQAGVDTEAFKARFWPTVTIETTKETIEWVRAQTPLGPRS